MNLHLAFHGIYWDSNVLNPDLYRVSNYLSVSLDGTYKAKAASSQAVSGTGLSNDTPAPGCQKAVSHGPAAAASGAPAGETSAP